MTLSEPATLLTDYLLAAVAAALGTRLAWRGPARPAGRRLWAAAFLVGAVAALAGGTVHGFAPSLPPLVRAGLWKTWLVGAGLANGLLLLAMAAATLPRGWRRAALVATAGKLALYLVAVTCSDAARLAVGDAAVTIPLILVLALAGAGEDRPRLGWLVMALAVSALGLGAQVSRVALHPRFNHNDVCHVGLAAALVPLYRAGGRLGERGGSPTSRP
jgi:hypothetical protein